MIVFLLLKYSRIHAHPPLCTLTTALAPSLTQGWKHRHDLIEKECRRTSRVVVSSKTRDEPFFLPVLERLVRVSTGIREQLELPFPDTQSVDVTVIWRGCLFLQCYWSRKGFVTEVENKPVSLILRTVWMLIGWARFRNGVSVPLFQLVELENEVGYGYE